MEEELEKEIQRYNEEQDGDCRYVQTARHFARWMRKQMMKEAVEVVIEDIEPELDEPYPIIPVGHLGYCVGDKVKLIIVKED